MESFQLTGIVAASPVAVQIVQYMRLSTEPVELLLEVYVGWYYSNQGLLILSTKITCDDDTAALVAKRNRHTFEPKQLVHD